MSRRITPQIARRIIDGFERKYRSYGRGHIYLAYHAAFPLGLTPELLYLIWANFQRDLEGKPLKIPWIAVADLLLSALCEEVGYELYEMEAEIRNELLRRLVAHEHFGKQRLQELARFLLAYVERQLEPHSDDLNKQAEAEAQKWTALAYIEPSRAAEALRSRLDQLVQAKDQAEQIRMANLIETLAEPLVEAGFKPLLLYAKQQADKPRTPPEQAIVEDEQRRLLNFDDQELEQDRQQTDSARQRTAPPVVTPQKALDIGSERVCAKDGMVQVYVPAGTFLMGSRDDDPDAYDYEKPQHEVYLDAYWIDKTPVTNAMFSKFVAETDYNPESNWQSKAGKRRENHPVVYVNWHDAVAYAKWAERRLPTEAEWEKAAGGTDGRKWPWGNERPTNKLCNFNNNVGDTTPVGDYPAGASPYGALDMAGNIWEWCYDNYDANYYASSPKANPLGPETQRVKVLRGGSLFNSARYTRARDRYSHNADYRNEGHSFRCAHSPL